MKSMWLLVLSVCVMLTEPVSSFAQLRRGEPAGELVLQGLGPYQHRLNHYAERPGTAILFLSARCPVVETNLQQIWDLHQKYRRRDILYVGVISDPRQSPDEIREFMQKRGFMFPVYRDPEGTLRRRFGATVTPEVFLLDSAGKLVFHGGLDRDQGFKSLELAELSLLTKAPAQVADVPPRGTSLDAEIPPFERDNPYGRMSFASQMIFEKIPAAAAFHCSTLMEAANRDLLCLWYGGTYESADDEALYLSRLKPGALAWSTPRKLISDPVHPPGNAILFVDGLQRLWMVWARLESPRPIRRGSGWGNCRLMYRVSQDHGETWSEDRALLPEGIRGVPRNNPLHLKSGRIVLPVEADIGPLGGSAFLGTSNNGETWEISPLVTGGSQPTLAQRSDGSLFALMRQAPQLTQVESRDEGRTWTAAQPTRINNPDSGISMTRLKNGTLLLVYNDSPEDRTPLNITRSTDEGRTWEKPLVLESNPGEYSYPCIVQTSDGMIHISYTFRRYAIKHVRMNETWLTQFEHPN